MFFAKNKFDIKESDFNAFILFEDDSIQYGYGAGKAGVSFGEICFNTAMSGYQESITDPSFFGQIITFTFPHIGNVGTNNEDNESPSLSKEFGQFYDKKIMANGVILHEKISKPSNFRNQISFDKYLKDNDITAIHSVDTRQITKKVRKHGSENIAIYYAEKNDSGKVFSKKFQNEILAKLKNQPSMNGLDLASKVSCIKPYTYCEGKKTIVAFDFGIKLNILKCLKELDYKVIVVPAKTTANEVLKYNPNGVFLSNGPGDPSETAKYVAPELQILMEKKVPIFGICLGHQLLALSLGLKTTKMEQGHRGYNHPVFNYTNNTVEITSQNHGFKVLEDEGKKDIIFTHKSLFDGSVEGLSCDAKKVFSVQYHPESSPGPHDSRYLFDQFAKMIA